MFFIYVFIPRLLPEQSMLPIPKWTMWVFFWVYCLCKTKWEIIVWEILIRLLFLLSSCSIKNSLKFPLLDFIDSSGKLTAKLFKAFRKRKNKKKRGKNTIWNKYTWGGAVSERKKIFRIEHSQAVGRDSVRKRARCVHRGQGCRTEQESSHRHLQESLKLKLITQQQWVSKRRQAAPWAAMKGEEGERTENERA